MQMEYSDPGISKLTSKMATQGQLPGSGGIPRAPIAPTAPDQGPIDMNPMAQQSMSPSMYIPGASRHEVIHMDEGAADTVQEYAVGIGSWQSRSHGGHAQPESPDCSLRPQGPAPRGTDMEGAEDFRPYPKHSEGDIASQTGYSDSNAKSYDSQPIHMDYSCDMGKM